MYTLNISLLEAERKHDFRGLKSLATSSRFTISLAKSSRLRRTTDLLRCLHFAKTNVFRSAPRHWNAKLNVSATFELVSLRSAKAFQAFGHGRTQKLGGSSGFAVSLAEAKFFTSVTHTLRTQTHDKPGKRPMPLGLEIVFMGHHISNPHLSFHAKLYINLQAHTKYTTRYMGR